jgi:TetR/AcrR family transcriptional regulator, cholesterol catabolism regulator
VRASNGSRANGPRRREIVDAAARIFHEKSYVGTTMRDIADEVGMLKGSLYHHIESKEDLLFEIIRQTQEAFFARIDEIMAAPVDGGSIERIRLIAREHVLYNARNLERTAICYHDMRFLSPKRFALVTKRRDRHERLLRSLIRRGQDDGAIRRSVDPKLGVMALLSMVNWLYHWYRPGGERDAADVAEQFAEIAVASLSAHATRNRGAAAPPARRSRSGSR